MIPVKDSQQKGFAPITYIIIILNLLVFVQEIRLGEPFIRQYAATPKDLLDFLNTGKTDILMVLRNIFVSAFMHAGYIHLLGNMLFFYVFSPSIERKMGFARYIIFYTMAIYISFFTHAAFNIHSNIQGIGASGAIAAVMGAYLIFFPKAKITTIIPLLFIIKIIEVPSVIFMAGWFLLQGLSGYLAIGKLTPVAWFAHIGGFIAGVSYALNFRFSGIIK